VVGKSIAGAIYYRLFRTLLRLRCWAGDRLSSVADKSVCPVPPAMLRCRVTESTSVTEFLRVGAGCAGHIEEQICLGGVNMVDVRRILDFGCGCARTLRWLIPKYPQIEFHGVDVDEQAIRWCKRAFKSSFFSANSPAPPVSYPASYFDIVYCFSVFTHLDELMQDAWLSELRRVLRPGGLLIFTVHGGNAVADLKPESRAILRAQGFVHQRSKTLKGIVPDWYNTTWHTREYIISHIKRWYTP